MKEVIRGPGEALLKVHLASLPEKQFDSEKVERILVFAYHGLGNFIMYTPALRLLRTRYPQARIDLQVGNQARLEEVVEGSDLFDNIYRLPYGAGLSAWIKRACEIRSTQYDLTINEFHSHSWILALLVVMSGAPFRIGHVTSPGWSRRFSRYSFIFNIPVGMKENEHEIDRYADLVAAAGADRRQLSDNKTFVHLMDQDREFAESFLETVRVGSGVIVGMQPGTSPTMRWKQWPLERYRELIERLVTELPAAHLVLFGAPGEVEMIEELARGLESKVTVAAGKTTVKQAAALIESCNLLVCNDSGLMHVAVAVGTPVVAIYGPTDIERTAPLGPRHRVIRHDLPCSPCFKLEGDSQVQHCSHHDCLMTISSDEVMQTLLTSMSGASGNTAAAIESPRLKRGAEQV
jgi:lipopolysaccharide heptosyltransferase II